MITDSIQKLNQAKALYGIPETGELHAINPYLNEEEEETEVQTLEFLAKLSKKHRLKDDQEEYIRLADKKTLKVLKKRYAKVKNKDIFFKNLKKY